MFTPFGTLRTVASVRLSRAFWSVCALFALSLAAFSQQAPAPSHEPAPPAIAPQTPLPAGSTTDTSAPPSAAPGLIPSDTPAPVTTPVQTLAKPEPGPTAGLTKSAEPLTGSAAGLTEDDLKKLVVGKVLYLRGGYLDDNLSFNEHGVLTGHSPQGSYTLSGVAIDRIHLTKHKVELEGQRYGLHFLGALPSEDPTTAMDRVVITPKKKVLRITIDRETVVAPKKVKEKQAGKKSPPAAPATPGPTAAPHNQPPDTDQAQAEMAAAPPAERPADPSSITTTTSPAHAAALLKDAIDRIFSVGFDDRMMAAMPDFWKLYYQAVEARTDYRPSDPSVLRQSAVDRKARLVSVFEPASNEFAQAHGVAGLALYHVVIGADGKPGEIAVARPIGFGLDESAADSIRKAAFEPALKNGQLVPVLLDLIVEFHIYSGRTGATGKLEPLVAQAAKNDDSADSSDKADAPLLPGPYSVRHP